MSFIKKNRFNSTLKKNIVANFVGSIWQIIMGLAFIPIYIKFIGIESWGLIGVFTTLQAIFSLMDVGLGSALTREMARLSVLSNKEQEMRNLLRTLEIIYWSIAVSVGVAVVLLSPLITQHWIKAEQLSLQTIEQALLIMGFVIAFQMPIGFYSGGLIGLQEQVLLNSINICMSTLRGAGVILILWLVSPTVQAFLLWQIFISITNVFLLAFFLWSKLPIGRGGAVFQKQLLDGIWKFAAGMSGVSILAVILTNLDKVILSKLLSLEMFGYYMLASTVGMSLARIFTPIFSSIYPRMTQLVSINDQDELKRFYHKSCQFMAVLILPIAITIALFSYEIILLWTNNPITAEKTHLLVSIMICGTALNGLMNPPYALQLAFGWTKLPLYANLISVILLVPLIILLVAYFGAIGGAVTWLVLNIGYVIFWIPIMHKRLLINEKWRWYWQDVCVPFVACTFVAGLGRFLIDELMSPYIILQYLIIISALTLGVTAIATPITRQWVFVQLLKK